MATKDKARPELMTVLRHVRKVVKLSNEIENYNGAKVDDAIAGMHRALKRYDEAKKRKAK